MGCCNQPIFGIEVVNCQLLFKNEAGYVIYTFELEDLRIYEGDMPLEMTLSDGETQITLRQEMIDSTIVPDTYATMDILLAYFRTEMDTCYCPCSTPA